VIRSGHIRTQMNIEKAFAPENIAIFGVSASRSTLAAKVLENLIRWEYCGGIFPINPDGGDYKGKKIYGALTDVEKSIDLAIVVTRAGKTIEIIDKCHEKGIDTVCILSSGFDEAGAEQSSLGRELRRRALEYGIDVIGPNCLGIMNPDTGLCTLFVEFAKRKPGIIGVISQSGALGISLTLQLDDECLGFSKFASIGNKLVCDEVDFLRYFIDDDRTKVILMYLESCERGRELMREVERTNKPIIIFKANITEAGAIMAKSHTASLRGNHKIFTEGMKQAGAIIAEDFKLMGTMAKSFLLPQMQGKRIGIISGAGGQLVMAADAADEEGFKFPRLSEKVKKRVIPDPNSGLLEISNPMDLGASSDQYQIADATDALVGQEDINAVTVMGVQRPAWWIERYEMLYENSQKPVLFCLNTNLKSLIKWKRTLPYPVFDNIRDVFYVLNLMYEFYQRKGTFRPWRHSEDGGDFSYFGRVDGADLG